MKIALIQGHPDPGGGHFCHALAAAYGAAARAAGHEVRLIDVAQLSFPLLRSKDEFERQPLPDELVAAQEALGWAEHVAVIFPLWLGELPALLKGFLEQICRPGFAFAVSGHGWTAALRGKSARVIVTMGMPALVYRWYFRAHGVKNLERNVLKFVGIKPVRTTLIGSVETLDAAGRGRWLDAMTKLGRAAR